MSSAVSGSGTSWPVAPPIAEPDRRTKSLRSRIRPRRRACRTRGGSRPRRPPRRPRPRPRRATCAGRARAAERAALAVLGDRAVGATHFGGGLLVVDVLELHEGAVAGGQEAGLDGLAAAVGPDAQLDVHRGQLALVGAERPARLDTHRPARRASVQVELGLELEVGALDLVLEGLVEQVLDAVGVIAAAARAERQHDKAQRDNEATHAAQDSGRDAAARTAHRNPSPSSSLEEDGPARTDRRARAGGDAVAAAPAQAGEVILVTATARCA